MTQMINKHIYNIELESNETKALDEAIFNVTSELRHAEKSHKTNQYKYAKYEDMVDACKPLLVKNKLRITHNYVVDEDKYVYLLTMCKHYPSGQFTNSLIPIGLFEINNEKKFGAACTYAKKLSYSGIIGLGTGDNDADDNHSNGSSNNGFYKKKTDEKIGPRYEKIQDNQYINHQEIQAIEYELREMPDIKAQILDGFKITNFSKMPKDKFDSVLRKIRTIKEKREAIS